MPAAGERGFFLHRGHYGAYALNDTQMNIAIPREDALVYAPTHLPAGYSCLETTTVHWRPNDPNSNATHHAHGFWDHCNKKGWDTYEQMTSAWQTKYVRVVDNRSRFYSKIEKVGDCWRGSLYDWASYSWVTKADACGAGPYEYGWTMWESSNLMSADTTGSIPCYDLPWITSKYITIKTYWGWYRVSTSHTSSLGPVGKCWENGTYKFAVPESNHHWQGQTRP